MPSLCDVNVLLAVCYRRHLHHAVALRWLDTITEDGDVIICRFSQMAFLRLLNNPASMMGQPLNASQVWHEYDTLMSDGRFTFRQEPEHIETILRRLMAGKQIAPRIWPDAYLAAFAIAGQMSLVTFDYGFRQFAGLDLQLLGDVSP